MWKNKVEQDRLQMTTWRKRIACCVTKATHTHTQNMKYFLFHNNNCDANAILAYFYTYISCFFKFVFGFDVRLMTASISSNIQLLPA